MTSNQRASLFVASFVTTVAGVWLAFGVGIALIVSGLGGATAAVVLSYLAVTPDA